MMVAILDLRSTKKNTILNGHTLQGTFLSSYNFSTIKDSKKIYEISEVIIGLTAILILGCRLSIGISHSSIIDGRKTFTI
jgi:hypothetical protein